MSVPPNKSIISKPKYPIPLKSTSGFPKYCLEGEVKEKFFELYPTHTHPELMQLFGVSYSTIARFAKQYGLQKNIEVIKSKRIKAIKKTCTENGYYASLRGRRPSEASIEATKRIRAAGFSPLAEFKKKDPKKFKRMCQTWAEKRKDLVRRDRLRMEYDLPRLSNLRLKLKPLSHAACCQKANMIKKKNYFADPDHSDWVCYDSKTDRSPQMEATAHRHGLYVVAGEEEINNETNET